MASERLFYIQDRRSWGGDCVTFWCPEGAGYTYDIEKAGRFTEQQVREHTRRETDVAIPCDELEFPPPGVKRTTRVVMQGQLSDVHQYPVAKKDWDNG